ncbi:MAG: Na+/H+ antiporter NhaA [Microbacteriaceae bacterium]
MTRRRTLVTVFRSERYSAISLLAAAVLGLALANSVAGPGLIELTHQPLGVPGTNLELSLGHWVTDGLLALFFFIVAVELRHELTRGELNSPTRALAPAVAAAAGVALPALVYLLIAGSDFARGWPIPVATDIAFALGLIALVGRGLPASIRVFLLALAVIDDLIAIVLIAALFAHGFDLASFVAAIGSIALFCGVGCLRLTSRWTRTLRGVALVVLAIAAWAATYSSGIHATIAGVALGLVLRPGLAEKAAHALQPFVNAAILPLFAFVSSLVILPRGGLDALGPVFFAIAVALPVGKIVGITVGGWIVGRITRPRRRSPAHHSGASGGVQGANLVTVSAVAGIGFTVSLLMNQLAFADSPALRDQGVLGVLAGSAISILVGGSLVAWRARVARSRTGGHAR